MFVFLRRDGPDARFIEAFGKALAEVVGHFTLEFHSIDNGKREASAHAERIGIGL